MHLFIRLLLAAVLAASAAQASASTCSPSDPTSDCSTPPPGALLDLAGTPAPTTYQLYTVTFDALGPTQLTFAFRSDPASILLDDVTLAATSGGSNLIVNGDFEGGSYAPGTCGTTVSQPAGWTYQNPNCGVFAGQLSNDQPGTAQPSAHGGLGYYADGIVDSYDFLSQMIPTVAGINYTLSFYALDSQGGTFSQTSVTGGGGGEGGEGEVVGPHDLLVYATPASVTTVPEPGSLALLALGTVAAATAARRRRR